MDECVTVSDKERWQWQAVRLCIRRQAIPDEVSATAQHNSGTFHSEASYEDLDGEVMTDKWMCCFAHWVI